MTIDVSIFGVFVAGIVSFLSPCVLPLVPGYVSMLSGVGVEQLKEGQGSTGKLLSSAFAFVIGFSTVFITFGASASAVGLVPAEEQEPARADRRRADHPVRAAPIGWLVKISIRIGLVAGAY